MERKFIETPLFPFNKISEASAVEKGPGRPPHWEMVFWWTRKPLISARAIIAGALLPENTDPRKFLSGIGINEKTKVAHKNLPFYAYFSTQEKFNAKLLDPFAGFGSIPLESLRLNLDTTAVELLPTAYIFLKAILEYPKKYGKKLIKDIEKWGNQIIQQLTQDTQIQQLYDQDTAVYIGTWEIKCPTCKRWTPLIGNWWLTKTKNNKGYERLTWMQPKIENDEIKIDIIDINNKQKLENVKIEKNRITIGNKEYRVPEPNINARREQAICLHCGSTIAQIDPHTGKHYTETNNLSRDIKERLKSYVKYALKTYNQSIEQATPETAVLARQRLLVKVKVIQGDLVFEPCTEEDQQTLEKAEEHIRNFLVINDPDIPKEPIPPYGHKGGGLRFPTEIVKSWYEFFNPRQLLTLVKLVKLIREAGKQIEQEKIKEELSQEEAHKYAEAITTYLAIALIRYVLFNSITNAWNPGSWAYSKVRGGGVFATRGIAMVWNWVDISPVTDPMYSWINCVRTENDGLSYLLSAVYGSSSEVRVLLDDATVLSKLDSNEKFDLIVTDPPYYDDVAYAELSDFYYVWLKRALSDVNGNKLVPRFIPEAFFEKVGSNWIEISTQWEKYALSEVSLNPPRLGTNVSYERGVEHFQNLLSMSFITMASKLKDNGLLITYYAHTSPDAWEALLKAGWEHAGLKITNAFSITTESAQSVVSRGKLSMDTSIVVVWRKGASGSIDVSELYDRMVEKSEKVSRSLIEQGIVGRDLIIGAFVSALSVATGYKEVRSMGVIRTKDLVKNYVYPASYLGLMKALSEKADLKETVKSADSMFYLIVKVAFGGAKRKILESTDARIISIGTLLDLNDAVKWRILKYGSGSVLPSEEDEGEEEKGANVARAKTLILMEPVSSEKSKLGELLEVRGVGVSDLKIRCSVDALHVLEYFAISYSRDEFMRRLNELKEKFSSYVDEAIIMARIMAKVLPSEDVEKVLCRRVVEYLRPDSIISFLG
jgi:putative DNA methylase